MSKTTYRGIDYGRGTSNLNPETKIRFGVISQHALNPESAQELWQSGTDLDYEAFIDEAKAKIRSALSDYFSDTKWGNDKKSKLDQAAEDAFDAISDSLGEQYEGTGDCARMLWEKEGYKIQTDSSGGVWVMSSPYFTYAQFCSPCAPGACYLTMPLDVPHDAEDKALAGFEDNKCYCLGSDWFDDNKAPYPIYSVETGKPI